MFNRYIKGVKYSEPANTLLRFLKLASALHDKLKNIENTKNMKLMPSNWQKLNDKS